MDQGLNPYHLPYLTRDKANSMDWSSKGMLQMAYSSASSMENHASQVKPSNLLQKLDLIFKAVNYRSRLHGEAWRIASATAKDVNDISRIARELRNNPTDEMVSAAWGEGLRNTFQQPVEGGWTAAAKIAGAIDQEKR